MQYLQTGPIRTWSAPLDVPTRWVMSCRGYLQSLLLRTDDEIEIEILITLDEGSKLCTPQCSVTYLCQ
jgi:hypothetical protein